MTITYSIRNVTSGLVESIMFRKFFQMVFVGNDKRSLHIYTATIIGASDQKLQFDDTKIKEIFVSNLEQLKQFRMRFELSVNNNDSNEVISIENRDLTDTPHGFLKEIDCIGKVWGDRKCSILLDNQDDILDKLAIINENDSNVDKNALKVKTAELAKYRMLWVEQRKTGVEKELLRALAFPGECQINVECPKEPNARDDGSIRSAYAIGVPKDIILPRGVELVNWVCTTVKFKYVLDDTNLNYIIRKDLSGRECTQYVAPDFTWYFSPQVKSFIDNRNSMVEVKRKNQVTEINGSCNCPYQRVFCVSDKYQNSIDSVPNKLTVNFYHWTEDEQISSRQKYRLSTKDVLPTAKAFDDLTEINIFLDTADEHSRGNRQFILGVFISFALAFGIDSSRLESVEGYFLPLTYFVTADVWWILFLILFSLTLITKPSKLGDKSRKMSICRKGLLIASLLWFILVFALFRSPILENNLASILHNLYFQYSFGIAFIILMLAHLVYLKCSKINQNDSLLFDLFGRDIL